MDIVELALRHLKFMHCMDTLQLSTRAALGVGNYRAGEESIDLRTWTS